MSKTAKKPAKKKAASKKKTSNKKPAKTASQKKNAASKKPAKKTAKKASVKKKTPSKASAKKTSAKKAIAKKVVKKKAVAKKAAPKRKAIKKVAVKKVVTKKATPKRIAVKRPEDKKEIAKAAERIPSVNVSKAKAEVVKKITEKKSVQLPGGIIVNTPRETSVSTNPNPRPALVNAIIEGLEERKAKHIVVLDLHKIHNRSFDYFIIADADSSTHVEAIASSVEEEVKKKTGERPYHTEGWQNAEWILLDYINVVVHVFQKPIRDFYNIEDLWADAEMQKIN